MLEIIKNWNPDSTEIPEFHYDSLCHFDYNTEYQKAENYRKAELPFVLYNHPQVDAVAKKWNDVDYLQQRLGSKSYRTESSSSNHFMYFRSMSRSVKNDDGSTWKPPTKVIQTRFDDWVKLAVTEQAKPLENMTHQYFRVSSDMGNPWLYDELPFFKPVKSLFMVDVKAQQGIHCRFGMKGVIAEAHFDGSRNAVAMLGGLRRWILTHPDQCSTMHMYPRSHPSSRHSKVDWSKPDVERFPNFKNVVGNEVILQAGDVLYVPIYWIHYIVSLNVNFQCNSRSGYSSHYDNAIRQCGF